MNRKETAKYLQTMAERIKVMNAFVEGKKVQWRPNSLGEWHECSNPAWHPGGEYRIKPEPQVIYVRDKMDSTISPQSLFVGPAFETRESAERDWPGMRVRKFIEVIE